MENVSVKPAFGGPKALQRHKLVAQQGAFVIGFRRMNPQFIFVTGTDTGVGKTMFASLLARQLCELGVKVAALKPVCSGGREDARMLRRAAGNVLSLDKINPWHYRAALSPLLAARSERKKLHLVKVVRHIQYVAQRFDVVIVEGAGGLLSPLGEDFDSRDLIIALKAVPVVVVPNRLGAVNQTLLVLDALPSILVKKSHVVLVNPAQEDVASRTNPELLREMIAPHPVHIMAWSKPLVRI